MLKIRDLGLNALPLDMATKKGGTKCPQKTHCPLTIPTGGKSPKKKAIGRDEIEQLQHQLQHRLADDVTH